MRRARRSSTGGLTAAIILIGLVFAFSFHGFNLPIFFVALALAIFVGSIGTLNPRRIYGGIIGAMWMLILALYFITHLWVLFLVGAAISVLLGTFLRAIVAWIIASGVFGLSAQTTPPQPQQYYTPASAPPQPLRPEQTYQQGYQPSPIPQQPETYKEGDRQYYYPPQSSEQYERPQTQYPQQLPPQ
ncbi:MAG: hypothetical protein NVS2B12_09260 [Ktedonobacteraceae bacterium]